MITKVLTIEDRLEFMRKEGRKEVREEIIRNLLMNDLDIDVIVKITGLKKSVVEEIVRKSKH